MLNYIAGLIIFALLLLAKRTLVFLLISKKQVALSLAIIVLSELLMVFTLYISIDKYGVDSLKLLIGFMVGVALTAIHYTYKFLAKDSEKTDNEL